MISTTTPTVHQAPHDVLAVANTPVLWACAVGVFAVIVIQSIVYFRAAKRAAPAMDMSPSDVRTAFRVGAIAAIGPSMAVVVVAIALLSLFGTPAVLVRIGLVGSAAYETGAASISAQSIGAQLSGDSYTPDVYALVFAAMTMGGISWMIATLVFTPILKRGDSRLRSVNPALMTVIPPAAMTAAFAALGLGTFTNGFPNVVAYVLGATSMLVVLVLARFLKADWLKDWSLGICILVSLAVMIVVF